MGALGCIDHAREPLLEAAINDVPPPNNVEPQRLGLSSGIQDQRCSAHGGGNFIEASPYPLPQVHRSAPQRPLAGTRAPHGADLLLLPPPFHVHPRSRHRCDRACGSSDRRRGANWGDLRLLDDPAHGIHRWHRASALSSSSSSGGRAFRHEARPWSRAMEVPEASGDPRL